MCSFGVCLAVTAHVLLVFSNGNCQVEPNVLVAPHGNGTRIRGFSDRVEKDFVLAGLFPVHGTLAGSSGGRCGEIRHEAGVEYAEAMLFALDRINSDTILLPNLTLGYDLRDTCYSENIGLDEALDLIITGTERQTLSCNASPGGVYTNSSEHKTTAPTFGIIGPTASGISVHVASLARLFEMPQVSSASSSALLSNRDKYNFFYRTIPPDNLQAKVIISVLLHFNWTHISVIYSKNAYGSSGKDEIAMLAKEKQICIDLEEGISTTFQDDDFSMLAATLDNSTARVVVAFITSADAGKLLKAMVTRPSFANITWIASDDWSEASSVLANFDGHRFGGVFGIVPAAQHVEYLHSYLTQLTIARNTRNPWFAEYFSARTGCDLDTCSVNMSISEASQRHLLPLVVDAVYALAHALDNFLKENCNQPLVWYKENITCMGQKREFNGTNILSYLKSVSFVSPTGNKIEFDNQGNIKNASYNIINYQVKTDRNGTYGLTVDIGLWRANGSTLEDNSIGVLQFYENSVLQFGTYNNGQVNGNSPVSECGRCNPGQKHVPVISSCCGVCKPCLGQEYSDESQASGCKNCSDFGEFWGNNPLVGSESCVQIKEAFLNFSNPYSIAMIVIASLGLLSVIFVSVVFGLHWNTPVVKSSSREQMVLLLIGISISFLVACFYIAPPVLSVCIVQRIGLWFCYSLIFGALLIKVIRISRIFLRKTRLTRPKYSETHYQILFTLLVVIGQMLLVTASVAYERPSIHRHLRLNKVNNDEFPEIVITCEKDPLIFLILSVIYESALIATMTILGVVSFKFPANFNEAKHISFCTFAVVVIWVGFIPSYFATQHVHEYQDAIIAMAVVMSAIATLACVFGPRLFIIFFWPQKNSNEYSRSKMTAKTETDRRPSNAQIILNEDIQSPNGFSECAASDSICVNEVALQEAQEGESQNKE